MRKTKVGQAKREKKRSRVNPKIEGESDHGAPIGVAMVVADQDPDPAGNAAQDLQGVNRDHPGAVPVHRGAVLQGGALLAADHGHHHHHEGDPVHIANPDLHAGEEPPLLARTDHPSDHQGARDQVLEKALAILLLKKRKSR